MLLSNDGQHTRSKWVRSIYYHITVHITSNKSINCHDKTPLAAFHINVLTVVNSVRHKVGHFGVLGQSERACCSMQLSLRKHSAQYLLYLSRLFQKTFSLPPYALHRVVHIIFCYVIRSFFSPSFSRHCLIFRSCVYSSPADTTKADTKQQVDETTNTEITQQQPTSSPR